MCVCGTIKFIWHIISLYNIEVIVVETSYKSKKLYNNVNVYIVYTVMLVLDIKLTAI